MTSSRTPAAPPSRTRFGVLYFGVTLAIIQYIDRVCIAQAMPDIRSDLGITGAQYDDYVGYVFSAFALAYALFEIPTGWMGDRFGPRKTLTRVVIWWSFFTAATGWMWSVASLVVTRFLFGMGEAGCFPNLTRAFATWLRPEEKARAQGVLWLCARWGGAITPILVALVLARMSWRHAFMAFAVLGLVWAIFFYRWFRDDPRDHPRVNAAEWALLAGNPPVARHDAVPWKAFLASRTTWLLWAQYFFMSYCWYFYVTWLPTYLKNAYGSTLSKYTLALLAGVPLFGGGFGNLISGFLTARLARTTGLARARKILAGTGFTLAGAIFLLPAHLHDPVLIMLAMGFASLFGDLSMPSSWAACMDVGGKFAGTYSGAMNMMGNFGGALAPAAIGHILKLTNRNWAVAFYLFAGAYFLGALCWLFIDPVTPLAPDEEK